MARIHETIVYSGSKPLQEVFPEIIKKAQAQGEIGPIGEAIQSVLGQPLDLNTTARDVKVWRSIFGHTLLTPDAPGLSAVWPALKTELKPKEENRYSPRHVKAFLLSDTLTYQTGLPYEQRACLGLDIKDEVNLAELTRSNFKRPQDYSDVLRGIFVFQGEVSNLVLPNKLLDTEEVAKTRIALLESLLSVRKSDFYKIISDKVNPLTLQWLDRAQNLLISNIAQNPLLSGMLLEGKLDEASDQIKRAVWMMGAKRAKDKQSMDSLMQYFFLHKTTQDFFWKSFMERNNHNTSQHKESVNSDEQLFEYTHIRRAFVLSPEKLRAMLETAHIEELTSPDRAKLIRKLIGLCGQFQSSLPQADTGIIKDYIKEKLGSGAENPFADELDILEDKKPGIICINPEDEGRARFPRNETKEKFLEEQARIKTNVVYVSQGEWSTGEIKTATKNEKKEDISLNLDVKDRQPDEDWGEIAMPKLDSVPALIGFLDRKFYSNPDGMDQEKALDVLAEQQKGLEGKPITIIPEILPSQHPLRTLAKAGIRGIFPKNGGVRFITDTPNARIAVDGHLDRGDLRVEGASDDFTYTPLHLLLNAASLLAKTNIIEQQLTRQEIYDMRAFIKDWNHNARKEGLPQLGFDDTSSNGPSPSKVLYFVGKKPVLLNLHPVRA